MWPLLLRNGYPSWTEIVGPTLDLLLVLAPSLWIDSDCPPMFASSLVLLSCCLSLPSPQHQRWSQESRLLVALSRTLLITHRIVPSHQLDPCHRRRRQRIMRGAQSVRGGEMLSADDDDPASPPPTLILRRLTPPLLLIYHSMSRLLWTHQLEIPPRAASGRFKLSDGVSERR